MLKTIAVINYKGGVGKTTLVANMATGLARDGYKVLMIDLDPQASLTFSFMSPDYWKGQYKEQKTIKQWYDSYLNHRQADLKDYFITNLEVNRKLDTPLTLVASHTDLFEVQVELARELDGATKRRQMNNKLKVLSVLRKEIEALAEEFDVVFIDCQPSFDLITQTAIIASDHYLIPTRLDFLSTVGVETLDAHINRLIVELNGAIRQYGLKSKVLRTKSLGLISTMVEYRQNGLIAANKEHEENMRRITDIPMFQTKIRLNQTTMGSSSNIPAILTKASSESEGKIIRELNDMVEELKERLGN